MLGCSWSLASPPCSSCLAGLPCDTPSPYKGLSFHLILPHASSLSFSCRIQIIPLSLLVTSWMSERTSSFVSLETWVFASYVCAFYPVGSYGQAAGHGVVWVFFSQLSGYLGTSTTERLNLPFLDGKGDPLSCCFQSRSRVSLAVDVGPDQNQGYPNFLYHKNLSDSLGVPYFSVEWYTSFVHVHWHRTQFWRSEFQKFFYHSNISRTQYIGTQ